MRRLITICAIGALVFVLAPSATAMMYVEPDAVAPGTVINNYYPGVTLTTLGVGPSGPMDPTVLSLTSSYPSTGTQVFGHFGAYADLWGDGYFDWLRADFVALPATQVSIDFIASDSSDMNPVLNAWDALDNLVDTATVSGSYSTGQIVTLTVTAPNIAYITAEGDPIVQRDNWALDNLQYEPVPVPAAVLLGILGLSVAGVKLRKFA